MKKNIVSWIANHQAAHQIRNGSLVLFVIFEINLYPSVTIEEQGKALLSTRQFFLKSNLLN